MLYIIITGYDKKSGTCHVVSVDATHFGYLRDYGHLEVPRLTAQMSGYKNLWKPLNFSVGESGDLVQDCGGFSRFSQSGSAVVLAEVRDKRKKLIGYRLLSCANNAIVDVSVDEIIKREQAKPKGEHFLQNGIVSGGTVRCYPNKPFPVVYVPNKVKHRGSLKSPDIPSWRILRRNARIEVSSVFNGKQGYSQCMSDDYLKVLMDEFVTSCRKQLQSDEPMFRPFGNMLNWIAGMPDTPRALECIHTVCREVPEIATLVSDAGYVKKFCPKVGDLLGGRSLDERIKSHRGSSESEYQAAKILSGESKPPRPGLSVKEYGKLLKQMVVSCKNRMANEAQMTDESKAIYGRMLGWLMDIPEKSIAANAIIRVRDELPQVMPLLFDDDFCKKLCPQSDRFFDENSDLLTNAARNAVKHDS